MEICGSVRGVVSFAAEKVSVTDNADSQMVATCLRCEATDLFTAMTQRVMKVGGDETVGEPL